MMAANTAKTVLFENASVGDNQLVNRFDQVTLAVSGIDVKLGNSSHCQTRPCT